MINRKRLIRLTQKLIQINSENPPGNELEIARFLRRYMEAFGLKCKSYEFARQRPNLVGLLKANSKEAKTILISPHLDTVPAGRGWKFPPFKGVVKNGRIYGRGATDCKGNLAVAIEVLNSLIEDKARLKNNILFAATADEESGSTLGLIPLLKKNMLKADYALILDSDEFDVVITQKGLIHCKVSLFGRKAHGAYPWKGINAINIASNIIQDLKRYKFSYRKHPLLREPTMNIGTIQGGDKVNMVADWCDFEIDVRYLPGMPVKALLSRIKKLIAGRAKRFKIKINGLQSPYAIAGGYPLISFLLKVWRKHHPPSKLRGSEGATVITFFKDKGIPAIATGFGSSGCAHINDEYAVIDKLYSGAKALEEFLKGLK
ncbi:MAG: hypothetical protein A3D27_01085 [Omnitrophica WOR_2 bacterium RIFCSPHIGHO2_02_FULL_46_37]|nr:MAG: hypothetical protein A3D27_01085 [Omnitrophica WOR_2 bacterium RIFCSPHIGHO2_02_FULL_46_37]